MTESKQASLSSSSDLKNASAVTHLDEQTCSNPVCLQCARKECPLENPDHRNADGCPNCKNDILIFEFLLHPGDERKQAFDWFAAKENVGRKWLSDRLVAYTNEDVGIVRLWMHPETARAVLFVISNVHAESGVAMLDLGHAKNLCSRFKISKDNDVHYQQCSSSCDCSSVE